MKILVTGAAGFIGSQTADALIKMGHEVLGWDNLSHSLEENIERVKKILSRVDLTDLNSASRDSFLSFYPDVIFHFACVPRIPLSIKKPLETIKNGSYATVSFLEFLKEAGWRGTIIYSSSSSVYGVNQTPFVENLPPNPLSPYAVDKLTAEKFLQIYNQLYGIKNIIFRYFSVYGPGQPTKGDQALAIGKFFDKSLRKEGIVLTGNGQQLRDFTYIDDVVDANIKILESYRNVSSNEVFNIGYGTPISVFDVATMISDNFKNGLELVDRQELDMPTTYADIRKAKRFFGWYPKVSIFEGIEKLKKHYAVSPGK